MTLLLAAGCGDDDEPDGAAAPSTASVSTTTGGSTAVPSPTSAPGSGAGQDGGGGGGAGTTAGPDPATAPGGDGPAAGGTLDATGPPGSFATELLGAATGTRLVVELQAQDGVAPRSGSLSHAVDRLRAASGKQVTVTTARRIAGGRTSWTDGDLRAAADTAAGVGQRDGRVVLRLLFVRGSYAAGGGVLGVAVRGDVAAVFLDEVERAAALGLGAAEIERAVVAHEVGHLLGLVDLALDTGREDPDHPGHSRNRGSVMYWAVESDLVGQVLEGGPPDDFDERDRGDLARLRELGSR